MQKLNQMSCVSPVEGKCMVAAPKASLPLDLSLTALLSAREQNVIRNTFLSEGLTPAESPGISEAVQLCKCLPISARERCAHFHFSTPGSHVVLSSISFHLKSIHCVWNTAVECWGVSEAGNLYYRVRENQLRQSEAPVRTIPYTSISPRYFYTAFNTVRLATQCLSSRKAPPLDLKTQETQKCTHYLVLMINYSHWSKDKIKCLILYLLGFSFQPLILVLPFHSRLNSL